MYNENIFNEVKDNSLLSFEFGRVIQIEHLFEILNNNYDCSGCKYDKTINFPCSTCSRYKYKKDCYTKIESNK